MNASIARIEMDTYRLKGVLKRTPYLALHHYEATDLKYLGGRKILVPNFLWQNDPTALS